MAEIIKVAALEIDTKALLTSLEKTKNSLDNIVLANKELKKAGDTSSKTFIENEAKIKSLRTEYGKQIKVLQVTSGATERMTKALAKENKTTDSAKENNAELRKIRNLLNDSTEEGAKAISELNKKIDKNTKFINKNSDATEKQKQNIGAYTKSINAAKIGSKAFGAILKGLGIGLIIAGVAKLTETFGRNQKLMNGVNVVFNAIGIVFDKVVGSIVDAVGAAYDATGGFDALGKVMGSLLTLILTPLKLTFYGIKLGLQETQLAWEKSFFGDKDPKTIKSLSESIKITKDDIIEVGVEALIAGKTIAKNFKEAISEVGTLGSAVADSTSKAIKSIDFKDVIKDAKSLVDAKNNTEALIIAQERLLLQYQTQAEKLRQIRDDESFSLAERKKANEELGALLAKQGEAERNIIALKIGAAEKEASLNKGNIEYQNEILRLKNEYYELEERITGQLSEKLANDNSLRNEELANTREFEEKKKELKDSIEEANIESEKGKAEIRIQQEYDKHLAELETLELNEAEKAELLKLLEDKKQQDIADIQEDFRKKDEKADKELSANKIRNKKTQLDAIVSLAGAESKIGKAAILAKQLLAIQEFAIDLGLFTKKAALAVGEATVDSSKGIVKSASAAPFPANLPLIAGFIGSIAGVMGTIKSATSKAKSSAKAEKGLLLSGARHSGGGIDINAEDGETIINRESSAKYLPLLSAINQDGGGVPFMEQGGIVGSTSFKGAGLINYDLLASKVAQANLSLPRPVVSVEEINIVSSRVEVAETASTL